MRLAETGIDTNSENNVFVRGPGLVRRFNGNGIVVSGNNSSVEGVAVTSICGEGIRVFGSHDEVEGNSVSRSALNGFDFPGIVVAGTGGHRILHNEVVGVSGGGFGIDVESSNNLIEENDASGNGGPGILICKGCTGNTVRHNQALGNVVSGDIVDLNFLPANNYDNNLCEIGVGLRPNICKHPDIAGHSNFEPEED